MGGVITARAAVRGRKRVQGIPTATALRRVQLPALTGGWVYTGVTWRQGEIVASTDYPQPLGRYDAVTGALIERTTFSGNANEITTAPNGEDIVATDRPNSLVRIFDGFSAAVKSTLPVTDAYALTFHDGDLIVGGRSSYNYTRFIGSGPEIRESGMIVGLDQGMVWTGRYFVIAQGNSAYVYEGFPYPGKSYLRLISLPRDTYGLGWDGQNLMSITSGGLVTWHANQVV